jgi:hypothetical protein
MITTVGSIYESVPIDLRLGYCTKHGSTTVCLQCTIDELRAENAELREWHGQDHARIMELIAKIDELEK